MRRNLLLVVAVLLAALGTSLVWLYVQGAENRAASGMALVTVYRASATVEPGQAASAVGATPARIPASEARNLVTRPEQIAGVTATRVFADQYLVPQMFTTQAPRPVREGNVAVSVSIDDPRRVPALLQPGQQVAIYAVVPGSSLRLVVREARVTAVGSAATGAGAQPPAAAGGTAGTGGTAATGGTGQAAAQIVTFEVSPDIGVAIAGIEAEGEQPLLMLLGERAQAGRAGSGS